ncbi:unnamed protein product, partial [Urochloa humidicola]
EAIAPVQSSAPRARLASTLASSSPPPAPPPASPPPRSHHILLLLSTPPPPPLHPPPPRCLHRRILLTARRAKSGRGSWGCGLRRRSIGAGLAGRGGTRSSAGALASTPAETESASPLLHSLSFISSPPSDRTATMQPGDDVSQRRSSFRKAVQASHLPPTSARPPTPRRSSGKVASMLPLSCSGLPPLADLALWHLHLRVP